MEQNGHEWTPCHECQLCILTVLGQTRSERSWLSSYQASVCWLSLGPGYSVWMHFTCYICHCLWNQRKNDLEGVKVIFGRICVSEGNWNKKIFKPRRTASSYIRDRGIRWIPASTSVTTTFWGNSTRFTFLGKLIDWEFMTFWIDFGILIYWYISWCVISVWLSIWFERHIFPFITISVFHECFFHLKYLSWWMAVLILCLKKSHSQKVIYCYFIQKRKV